MWCGKVRYLYTYDIYGWLTKMLIDARKILILFPLLFYKKNILVGLSDIRCGLGPWFRFGNKTVLHVNKWARPKPIFHKWLKQICRLECFWPWFDTAKGVLPADVDTKIRPSSVCHFLTRQTSPQWHEVLTKSWSCHNSARQGYD